MIKKSTKISSLMLAICFSLGLLFPATWAAAAMKTDINTATIEQLETVNGVGQDTAQNILDYKKEHGKFQTMEELEGVKGVGKVRSQALSLLMR
ncbi:MAG: helix-hairpin-helix domain-containing protein [Nitrospirae bacterium]|nr:helix-hairpin-helix domain-containing protein [Nitrospirota bacterium]